MRPPLPAVALCLLFVSGCSSSSGEIEPRRLVVGQENGVRVEAELTFVSMSPASVVAVSVVIENQRAEPIAIASVSPTADDYGGILTITLGAEIPGAVRPELLMIAPGSKRTIIGRGRTDSSVPGRPRSGRVRVKVNYLADLGEIAAFYQRQPAGEDAQNLFASWIENNATVITNAVPVQPARSLMPPVEPPRTRRGRP